MEEKKNNDKVKKSGILNEFLWLCAGVNRKILRECPTDWAKYAGIGGTILFTALMAMLSGGYAMYTVFDSYFFAIAFGIFWGLLIFNLDRFIVNTIYSDGKVTISWQELVAGFPRIIIALFLGIIISMPLELKIFEDEILVQIEEDKQARIREYQAEDYNTIKEKEERKDELRAQIDEISNSPLSIYTSDFITGNQYVNSLLKQRNERQAEFDKEKSIRDNCVNERRSLIRPVEMNDSVAYQREMLEYNDKYKRLTATIKEHQRLMNEISSQIHHIDADLAQAEVDLKEVLQKAQDEKLKRITGLENEIAIIDKDIEDLKDKINNSGYEDLIKQEYGGFQARMSAFNEMKRHNPATNTASTFIMLLFIIIETAPTFFKMMIAAGPYDDLLRSENYMAKVMSDKRISDINDEINTAIKISTAKNEKKLEAEVLANKELLSKIASVQAELINVAIEAWREEEMKKIKENPSAYIKVGISSTPPLS